MQKSDQSHPGIYAIINKTSDRVYVGSSVNIRRRWNDHKRRLRAGTHVSARLQHSWNKHGEGAFTFFVLEPLDDLSWLIPREQEWIDCLGAAEADLGYNLCPTAGNNLGRKATPETREKMRLARLGKKGHTFTAEQKERMRLSQLGKRRGPRTFTQKHKDNIRAAAKGRKMTPEGRAKLSAARKLQYSSGRRPFTKI